MKILIIGHEAQCEEAKAKFSTHDLSVCNEHREAEKLVSMNDVVFDFLIDEEPTALQMYHKSTVPLFINTAKMSLQDILLSQDMSEGAIFGFNGLPTLFNREMLEISVQQEEDISMLESICQQLGTTFLTVDDRVGMVTPRVICMIINEAYYTVQEGTATREDIDTAMKLGTNYPYGPFEWCDLIGIHHVYELLEAVYDDTHDERYKICPLLKKAYLKSITLN